MKAKHTPGPWEVREQWYIGVEGDPYSLAEVKSCRTVPASNAAEHAANALLIAAAPDLYAALKEIIEHPAAFSDGANRLWSQAQAALAKATSSAASAAPTSARTRSD